ncbi:Hypothetical protein A7982_06554 [Minicystis rosea]|nr:Hypothetical protein A7982_06554 [Minicystis rosea]
MNAKRLLATLLTVGLTFAAALPATDVHAQGRKKKEEGPAPEAPSTKKAISLPYAGVTWGQSPKQVADTVDKILDDDYRPLYKGVQPGIRMRELDAQIAEDKSAFRRSRIDFGKLPTGVDATPLRGEYTYNNRESLLVLTRKGMVTNFFFIQDKLWKVIEEHKFSDSHPLGKNYMEAVVKLSTNYGVPGRVLPPDGARFVTEVDWKDATTHLRAIQRGEAAAGLAFEDNATLASLASLRTNKPADDNGIDPDVAAAVRGKTPEPPPPDPKKKK